MMKGHLNEIRFFPIFIKKLEDELSKVIAHGDQIIVVVDRFMLQIWPPYELIIERACATKFWRKYRRFPKYIIAKYCYGQVVTKFVQILHCFLCALGPQEGVFLISRYFPKNRVEELVNDTFQGQPEGCDQETYPKVLETSPLITGILRLKVLYHLISEISKWTKYNYENQCDDSKDFLHLYLELFLRDT